MKKTFLNLLIPIFCLMMMLAFNMQMTLNVYASEEHPVRVVDEADILESEEETELLIQVEEISERQQFDVVIVTLNSLGGEDIQHYAADYFDNNGYGMGENHNGAMLLISMQDREWYILTTGYGIDALTDADLDSLADDIVPYLSEGDYATAFNIFAETCDKEVTDARERGVEETAGTGVAAGTDEEDSPGIIVSVIIGLILAFIPVLVMRVKLKSVKQQSSAGSYERRESRKITVRRDIFLYHTVNRVPRPKENNSGGSTTFVGSSGRSHGGRGGGF